MKRRILLKTGALGCLLAATGQTVHASDPSVLRIIVPFAAGGGTDIVARALTEDLAALLGIPVVVENLAGGNGSIGALALLRAKADGGALALFSPGVQITNPYLYERLPYDARNDFVPVVLIGKSPNFLVVHPSLPVHSVAELVAYAKANPGKLNFSSSGKGASTHLASELFQQMAGLNLVHVPYRGAGPAMVDLVAGRIQMAFDSTTVLYPRVQAGQLRVLGVSTLERMPEYPDVPTVAETLPGFESSSMLYMAARSGTAPVMVTRLNAVFNQVLGTAKFKRRFTELGMAKPSGGSPDDLTALIESERVKWKRVIELAGLEKTAP